MTDQYSDEFDENTVNELVSRANSADSRSVELTNALSTATAQQKDSNFLHIQISTDEMLEKLEHFYRGDVQTTDEFGNIGWSPQKNDELVTFNEFGVTSLMEIITKYIDRNTILSYYKEERIYEILSDIGDELVLFMLCNYDKIGMDTYFKKTKFRMIVTTTLHIIESTYRRALAGNTMQEINQSRVVGQFDNPMAPVPQQQRKQGGFFSGLFPTR